MSWIFTIEKYGEKLLWSLKLYQSTVYSLLNRVFVCNFDKHVTSTWFCRSLVEGFVEVMENLTWFVMIIHDRGQGK